MLVVVGVVGVEVGVVREVSRPAHGTCHVPTLDADNIMYNCEM